MMKERLLLSTLLVILAVLLMLSTLSVHTIAYAEKSSHETMDDKCMVCHEDLYFLHDTGNWFCLRESPMSCVDCHGGDASALTQEQAHTGRAAHPVLNDDILKCQECHPQECEERVQMFDQTAGISDVLVAVSYVPKTDIDQRSAPTVERHENRDAWLDVSELLQVLFLVGAAWATYLIYRKYFMARS